MGCRRWWWSDARSREVGGRAVPGARKEVGARRRRDPRRLGAGSKEGGGGEESPGSEEKVGCGRRREPGGDGDGRRQEPGSGRGPAVSGAVRGWGQSRAGSQKKVRSGWVGRVGCFFVFLVQ
ncbi:unnamed protein product [Triticum turgidum subsp. durum]|uniref:Uncharacterized protein n=1 Tax=Triticum turgidum subsp. durum TaxID=4567 RepID=A0A9R0SAG5_TRITD|nr:unnamed protein product [Triticum turgidum subsp. durum]